MGRPVFAVDNLFNQRIYPGLALSASSTEAGTDVLRLSSGRRRRILGGWSAEDLDTEAWVGGAFGELRGFDLVWIDRDHNLDEADSPSFGARLSDDDWTTYTELGPYTIPSAPSPMSALYDGAVVRTDEGALLLWLGLHAAWDVRIFFPAMGTGLRPELAGLALFRTFSPYHSPGLPFDFGRPELLREVYRSPQGQATGSQIGSYRHGAIRVQAKDWAEYAEAAYPLEELLIADGKPMVLVPDDEQAERAMLVSATPGQQGFVAERGVFMPSMTVAYEELDARQR